MSTDNLERKFRAIWCRYKDKWSTISREEIGEFCLSIEMVDAVIEEVIFGTWYNRKAVKLTSQAKTALFPRSSIREDLLSHPEIGNDIADYELLFGKVNWFLPPYISNGELSRYRAKHKLKPSELNNISEEEANTRFENMLPDLYSEEVLPAIVEGLFTKSESVQSHIDTIREAVIAFFSGLTSASIALLIPVIEDVLKKRLSNPPEHATDKVEHLRKQCFDKLKWFHYGQSDWYPSNLDTDEDIKRVDIWLQNADLIFKFTSTIYARIEDSALSGMNRNIFAHAATPDWKNKNNFYRAIGVLEGLVWTELFTGNPNNISPFDRDLENNGAKFAAHLKFCRLLAEKLSYPKITE